jgi:23S rRNA (cytosine1962-C5)-methyltransferase
MQKMKSIRLKSKEERRFRQGHPWVFSNELQESPKNLGMGEVVELCDSGGGFLAYGFANPHSLISFRELSRDAKEEGLSSGRVESFYFKKRIEEAWAFRKSWFSDNQSFRLVYGEADGLSGLIIDRFFGKTGVVYVIQPHAAGMDANLDSVLEALGSGLSCDPPGLSRFAILRRDASSREKEGISREPTKGVELGHSPEEADLERFRNFTFTVSGIMGSSLSLSADLVGGQKTGFFFDQLQNIRLLETLLLRKLRNDRKGLGQSEPYRILDLCSYVGQWSVHLLQTLSEREALPAEMTCVDASESALSLARKNIETAAEAWGVKDRLKLRTIKADVLEPMSDVPNRTYDLVIADPPAFIKNRKSIPQGKQAYVQLFQAAIEKASPGGLVVCCSCSQLLSHEDFIEVLGKASRRSKRKVRWLLQGSPSFDHFTRLDFEQGHYLKSFIGQVEESR